MKQLFERGLITQAQMRQAQLAMEKAAAQGDHLAEAKADLNAARLSLERSQTLLEKGPLSKQQIQEQQANVARAEQRLLQSSLSRAQLEQKIASTVADHQKIATDAQALHELLMARQQLAGEAESALKKNVQSALMEQHQALEKQRMLEQQKVHVAEQQMAELKHRLAGAYELPVEHLAPAATLRAQDVLRITIAGEPDLPQSYTVGADGTIRFPFVGSIKVDGLTAAQVRESLGKKLSEKKLGSADQVTINADRPRK
jgi:hypothetical protein